MCSQQSSLFFFFFEADPISLKIAHGEDHMGTGG